LLKDGFNAGLAKNFHIYLPLFALAVYGVTATVIYWNHDPATIELGKRNFPGYK
jgi:hypothetical protein